MLLVHIHLLAFMHKGSSRSRHTVPLKSIGIQYFSYLQSLEREKEKNHHFSQRRLVKSDEVTIKE